MESGILVRSKNTTTGDMEEAFLLVLSRPVTADTPCGEALAKRTANMLAARGIGTLGDAAGRTADEMLGWPGFGRTCLNDVVAGLGRAGLRLATPEQNDPTPVLYLELPLRARKCLRRLGIETVGQLLSTPKCDLLAVRNFGRVSLARIKAELERAGFVGTRRRAGPVETSQTAEL